VYRRVGLYPMRYTTLTIAIGPRLSLSLPFAVHTHRPIATDPHLQIQIGLERPLRRGYEACGIVTAPFRTGPLPPKRSGHHPYAPYLLV